MEITKKYETNYYKIVFLDNQIYIYPKGKEKINIIFSLSACNDFSLNCLNNSKYTVVLYPTELSQNQIENEETLDFEIVKISESKSEICNLKIYPKTEIELNFPASHCGNFGSKITIKEDKYIVPLDPNEYGEVETSYRKHELVFVPKLD